MPRYITKPACRNNVFLRVIAAVLTRRQVLRGTLKSGCLTVGEFVIVCEFATISKPHWHLAVKATALLAIECTQTVLG